MGGPDSWRKYSEVAEEEVRLRTVATMTGNHNGLFAEPRQKTGPGYPAPPMASRRRRIAPVARRVPRLLGCEGLTDEVHRIGDLALVIQLHLDIAIAVGQVSDLVDHQELLAGVEAELALEQAVGVDGGELAEQAGGGCEAHPRPQVFERLRDEHGFSGSYTIQTV